MPRPQTKHVTYAGTSTVILDRVERDKIAEALVNIGCDRNQAAKFADATNRAAVFAYELEHQMSTPGESKQWHKSVLKAIEIGDLERVGTLIDESAHDWNIGVNSEGWLPRKRDDNIVPGTIDALRIHCEKKVVYFGSRKQKTPRRATCRQLLAEELVQLWREQFGDYPPYREGSDMTFLDVLKRTIHLAEALYYRGRTRPLVTGEVLRNLTKRARSADRRRSQ